jgi:hypothetical protein
MPCASKWGQQERERDNFVILHIKFKQETSFEQVTGRDLLDAYFMLVTCFVNSLILKLEMICSSETSVYVQ